MTDKQILYCKLYAQTLNGAHSARVAGYASARQASYRLQQLDDVQALIADEMTEMTESVAADIESLSIEDVIKHIKAIAISPTARVSERLRALEYLSRLDNALDNSNNNITIDVNYI